MAELLLHGKRLEDLKVSELKDELDKRDLSKKGNKSSLLERLRKAVLEEVFAAGSATSVADDSVELDTSEVESVGEQELPKQSRVEVRVERLVTKKLEAKDTAPSAASEQTEDAVTSGGEQSSQQDMEIVIPKKPASGRKSGGKKRGRGGRIMSPRDKSSDAQPKLEDDSGILSLEESDNIKLEANLESKTEPLEPITESVPCELFTADNDVKEDTADEEEVKPAEEEADATDMGVPLHVEDDAMDFDVKEKLEDSQDMTKTDNDNVNLVPEPVADDLPDLEQQYGDEPSFQEDTTVKDDTIAMDVEVKQQEQSLTNDSATIDPSYAPENEELLYEGDVENDNIEYREGTPVMDEGTTETTAEENREQDLSLVLDLHVSGEMEDLQAKEDDQTAKGGEGASQTDKSAKCSLWVSGLGSTVSASDLKTLFSPFGSVSSAKVVAKPGSQSRFGFVTMRQEKEAAKCIEELNGKELKGATITVELAKGGSALVGKSKTGKDSTGDKKSDKSSTQDTKKASDGKSSSSSSSKNSKGTSSDKSSSRKESSSSHHHRSRSKHSPSHHSPSRGSKDRRKRSRSKSPQLSTSKAGRPAVRGELQRNLEMRLEPRLPEREIYLRRQLTLEQQEKDLMERIQAIREREIREREIRQQALAEQERMFRQKERELKEREIRERRRREELERVLRQGDAREREFRERERRMKEEFQRQLREQEMKAKHERQMRERDLLVQAQKEEQFRELERKLQETKQQYFKLNKEKEILAARAAKAEQEKLERERQLHDIQQRERRERELLEKRLMKEKAEQERAFIEKQKEMEERVHQQQQEFKRREMERIEAEKREWERERQHNMEVAKKEVVSSVESRERDKHDHKSSKSGDRGAKRPYNDDALYEEPKRPVRHDIRETMGSFHQGGMQQEGRSIRRESPPRGYERGRGQDQVGYPAPSGRGPAYGDRSTPTSRSAGLPVTPNLPPELINAANKALQTIQRAANASIPDQHRQSRPMPNSGGRPYGGGGPIPTSRPDPYPPRPGFQGSQMGGGGYPPSQSRMHDDRSRRVSGGAPGPYQGNYGRRY